MRLVAFQVSAPATPELGVQVVFAQDMREAIESAGVFDLSSFEGGEGSVEVRRLPDFDEYADEGKVPVSVLLDAGWSVSAEELGEEVLAFIQEREGR
jgi:hypothetical protein